MSYGIYTQEGIKIYATTNTTKRYNKNELANAVN